jgi:hypothetical protein
VIAQGFAVILFASTDLLFTVMEIMKIAADVVLLVAADVTVLTDDVGNITSGISIVAVVKVESLQTESPGVEVTDSNKVKGKKVLLLIQEMVESL